eukprot:365460-Chlamydomonas_euryale.AAC.7
MDAGWRSKRAAWRPVGAEQTLSAWQSLCGATLCGASGLSLVVKRWRSVAGGLALIERQACVLFCEATIRN